jgi:hypothetical protein
MNALEYPNMRQELLGYLQALSDKSYQLAIWVNGESGQNFSHDTFDESVHFLFDDTPLGDQPMLVIGSFLYNAEEVNSVVKVMTNIQSIFEKYGKRLSDAEYIELPEWKNVLSAAKSAVETIAKNGS